MSQSALSQAMNLKCQNTWKDGWSLWVESDFTPTLEFVKWGCLMDGDGNTQLCLGCYETYKQFKKAFDAQRNQTESERELAEMKERLAKLEKMLGGI